MMAVVACDAYFSDAYGDLLTRALRAKSLQPTIVIPDRLNKLRVPVIAVIREAAGGWRWRMAARELIEDENVLSLEKIHKLFNHFFRKGNRLLSAESIEGLITHPAAKSRPFGITAAQYRGLSQSDKNAAKTDAVDHLESHFEYIFQRRHDCIHNCDRPKVAVQNILATSVEKTIDDIDFLVSRCNEAFLTEFPIYLTGLGANAVTRNQVC